MTIGIWIIPLAITVLAFTVAVMNEEQGGMDWGIGAGIGNAFRFAAALIISLIAWLIWAIIA